MILHTLLLKLLFYHITRADYSGYNAAGRNAGWHSGTESDPINVPNSYHKPNLYENQPHSFWYENRPFSHAHANKPDTYTGKIHNHSPGEEPVAQNFITDPPDVGLNAPDNRDNFIKPAGGVDFDDCDLSNPYGANSDCNKPERVHPSTRSVPSISSSSPSTTQKPGEFVNPSIEEKANGKIEEKLEDLAVVGQETESIQEDRKPAAKKRPCCACCKDEEEVGLVAKGSAVGYNSKPAAPSSYVGSGSGRYVTPSLRGGSAYLPFGQYNPTQVQSSYAQSPFGFNSGGCQSSYQAQNGGCCGEAPSCCLPQLPCCPKIEFPCCPVQPICCQSQGCGQCRSRVLRQRRTKRFGCIPCAGRRKREVMEELHVRRKRLGCVPCLRRRKREQPKCIKCFPFTSQLVRRMKRSMRDAGCSSVERNQTNLTWKNVLMSRVKRAGTAPNSKDSDYDSLLECDKSCCDYSKCVRSKPLRVQKREKP